MSGGAQAPEHEDSLDSPRGTDRGGAGRRSATRERQPRGCADAPYVSLDRPRNDGRSDNRTARSPAVQMGAGPGQRPWRPTRRSRTDAAPAGTIVTGVQAAGQLAPVVRLYRRAQSSIQEVSCGTAKAGGKAVASVAAVRGAGYLILVGRRAGTPDGEFDLRADLVLPPDNDERGQAAPLGRLPATTPGTTLGATGDDYSECGMAGGGVWYRFKGPKTGRALIQLATGER